MKTKKKCDSCGKMFRNIHHYHGKCLCHNCYSKEADNKWFRLLKIKNWRGLFKRVPVVTKE